MSKEKRKRWEKMKKRIGREKRRTSKRLGKRKESSSAREKGRNKQEIRDKK